MATNATGGEPYNKLEYSDSNSIPEIKVAPVKRNQYLTKVSGPRSLASGKKDFFADKNGEVVLRGRSVSTYPRSRSTARQGDPVADRYSALVYENRTVLALADGCNWGVRPLEAADRSVQGFLNFLSTVQNKIKTTRDAASFLLKGIHKAHERIIEGKKDMFLESGTTTLLGAITLELKGTASKWAVVAVSVGESKLFLYSAKTRQVTEITAGNRRDLVDWRDPGGRLGPYVDQGHPDLRNLRFYCAPCEEQDILLLLTDGVHDNFHPYYQGKSVKDFNLVPETWEKAVVDHESSKIIDGLISQHMTEVLNQVPATPATFVNQLIRHSLEATKKVRTLLTNPKAKPPSAASAEYPGKLDHATALAVQVGRVDAGIIANEHEFNEWRIFIPKSVTEEGTNLGFVDSLLEQLEKKDPEVFSQTQQKEETEYTEYYFYVHDPTATLKILGNAGEIALQVNVRQTEQNVNTWVVGEGIPLSATSNKQALFRSLKESITNNVTASQRLRGLLTKIEGLQPSKDVVQLRGKRKEYRFEEFGGALKTLSGSLVVGKGDVEIFGENNTSFGSYRTVYLRGAKVEFISDLVSKDFNSLLQQPDWVIASVPELLCKLLGGVHPSASTSSSSLQLSSTTSTPTTSSSSLTT